MKKYLLVTALLLSIMACNNEKTETETTSTSDSASHNGHSTDSTLSEGQNHMKSMHDAMNSMMTQMQSMKPSGNPDYDFAMMMKHHHQGAVAMAQAEIAGGKDATMKQKAQKMIDDQQREITIFDKTIQAGTTTGSSDFGQRAMEMMTPMSRIKMESGSLDAMFASMMIPHHQDAIKMAQEYLKVAKNEELKNIAKKIISSQQKEVQELQEWINTHRV